MPSMSVIETVTAPGRPARQVSIGVTGDNLNQSIPTVPVAKIGALTTRTDNTSGTLTMNSGHGFNTADKIDLFWSGGQRLAVICGTVSTNSVPISGGSGDNLPVATTAITAMIPHQEVVTVVGDNVSAIEVYSDRKGYIVFTQSDGTVIKVIKIGSGGDTYFWYNDSTINNPVMGSNPLAGVTVGKILTSHDDSSASHTPEASLLSN